VQTKIVMMQQKPFLHKLCERCSGLWLWITGPVCAVFCFPLTMGQSRRRLWYIAWYHNTRAVNHWPSGHTLGMDLACAREKISYNV
jgi:hypothetical protein